MLSAEAFQSSDTAVCERLMTCRPVGWVGFSLSLVGLLGAGTGMLGPGITIAEWLKLGTFGFEFGLASDLPPSHPVLRVRITSAKTTVTAPAVTRRPRRSSRRRMLDLATGGFLSATAAAILAHSASTIRAAEPTGA